MLRTPNRVRPLRNGKHILHCSLCGKRSRWGTRWNGGGGTAYPHPNPKQKCDKQRNDHPIDHATFHLKLLFVEVLVIPLSTLSPQIIGAQWVCDLNFSRGKRRGW